MLSSYRVDNVEGDRFEEHEVEDCADGVSPAHLRLEVGTCRKHWGVHRDINQCLSVSVGRHSGMEDNKGFPQGLRI